MGRYSSLGRSSWGSRERISRERAMFWVAAFVLLGLALRLDFLFASNFVIDADEAIVGLMALDVSQGASWPVFYYGQHYMGSFEPLLVAGLFELFGPSSAALVAVPLCFGVALIPLTYKLAREVTGRLGALLAALFMAVPPTGLVVWSAKARGGFIEVVFMGALALLLTCRWLRRDQFSLPRTAGIGLVLGFGWWTNNQIIFFMLPIGFVMLSAILQQPGHFGSRVAEALGHAAVGLGAFVVGGAPFWWYNITHEFRSFEMFGRASSTGLLDHVAGLFSRALPMLLGAKRFWQPDDVFPYATLLAYSCVTILALGYLVMRAREVAALAVLRVDRDRPLELFSLFVLGALCTFVLSSFGWLYEAPRYLLPVYVGLFVLFGFVLERWYLYARWFAIAMLVLLLGLSSASSYYGGRAIPGEPLVFQGQRVERDHAQILKWLADHDSKWIRTNYWIGYRIAFETEERVKFLTYQDPQYERIPEYVDLAQGTSLASMPLVLVPAQGALVERALAAMGFNFQAETVSGYRVVWGIEPSQLGLVQIPSADLEVQASTDKIAPQLAIDGRLESRWGTGQPQAPGQEFVVNVLNPVAVRGVSFDLSNWKHDFPRGLRIELEAPDGARSMVLDPEAWEAVRYYVERGTRFDFMFPAREAKSVRFIQVGQDPIFDWSIAEVALYR